MNNNIKFRRNVYIILLSILAFGIMSQIARSDMMLKYVSNDSQTSLKQWQSFQQTITPVSMNIDGEDAAGTGLHCIIYNSEDSLSVDYYNNFQTVYSNLKQPYTVLDTASDELSFEACQAVIMTASIEVLTDSITGLEQYIQDGGYVFFARMDHPGPVFTKLYRKLGIVNYWYVVGNDDIHFTSNLLIGQKDVLFADDYFYNDSISVELDHDSELLAKGENQTPIAWRYEYGDGAVLVYNGNNLFTKSNRGLIVGAISMLIPDYIYPIFNAKLFYIDDYPAPMSTDKDPKITDEYNRNIASFFKEIWWPDMIKLAKNYDLKYTAVAIEDYNEAVKSPLPTYRQEDLTNLIVYGREVLKTGGEVGIHGYNHQPLQFRQDIADEYDYVVWNAYEDMEASIREVLSYTERAFPNYNMVSYVPPSNILSAEGRQVLVDNWETLRVISSLYEEDPKDYSYVQEFEIADDGIVEMPRITSGYADSPDMQWLEASVMTAYGFISHFIHPDDIFDDYRSGDKGWSELYDDFEQMLSRMESTYPWLEAQTSGEAAIHVAHVLNSQITRKQTDSQIEVDINNFNSNQFFILRSKKKIGRLTNCSVKLIDEHTYLVEATDENFNIELK